MYPYLKLVSTLLKARFRSKMKFDDECVMHFRVGLTDIDMFGELNNARYFHYMELARWDLGYRTGLLGLIKRKKWGLAVGGASIRYRRRITLFKKCTLTTRVLCHDGRWLYFLHEIHSSGRICSSALMKAGATSRSGLVAAPEVLQAMDMEGWNPEIPDWVTAWIEAEGKRPWPS